VPIQFTGKVIVEEGPPPGAGFTAWMLLICTVAKSLAGIATRSCPAFTNTMERGDPFTRRLYGSVRGAVSE